MFLWIKIMRIDEIDKNLKVDSEIDKSGLVFHYFEDAPFEIYGDIRRGSDGLLYRKVRAAHPDLPIVFITRPNGALS